MNRNKAILLNKATRIMKVLLNRYTFVTVKADNYNAYLTLQGINSLDLGFAEELVEVSKKHKIKWTLIFKENNLVINIWK